MDKPKFKVGDVVRVIEKDFPLKPTSNLNITDLHCTGFNYRYYIKELNNWYFGKKSISISKQDRTQPQGFDESWFELDPDGKKDNPNLAPWDRKVKA